MKIIQSRSNCITAYIFLLALLKAATPILAQNNESWKVYDDTEVATIAITVDPADLQWMYRSDNIESDSIHTATVRFKNAILDENIDSVGFRLRGNTSRHSAKKSFKLSFNAYKRGADFYGVEKLNLNGEHNDPSIARSKICWDLYQLIGMKTSRASHAAVYINGEYYGLYINIEHIDEEFIKRNYADDDGDLWRCLFRADLTYQGSDANIYTDPDIAGFNYELKTNTDSPDNSTLINFIDFVNNSNENEFEAKIDTIIKVEDVLKYLAFNVFVGSWDDYRYLSNNYYIYHEPVKDLLHLIPYDYDNTFGIDWFGINWSTVSPYDYPVFQDGSRPLSERLFGVNKFRNLYSYYLDFMNTKLYTLPLWKNDLDSLRSMLSEYARQDEFRTMDYGFTYDDFHNSFKAQPFSNQHVKFGIKQFLNDRHYSLNNMIKYNEAEPFIYSMDWDPKLPGPNDSIYVTAYAFGYPAIDSMKIMYVEVGETLKNYFEMNLSQDGNELNPDLPNKYVGVIPPLGPNNKAVFSVFAENLNGVRSYFNNAKLYSFETGKPVTQELLINELMARNSSTITEENGDYDDWIEIYNPGSNPVNLNGKFLTDSRDEPTKWKFNNDISIPPGETILIWCDGDSLQSSLHTNFKLDGDGEYIAIVNEDGKTLIDSVSFYEQKYDVSWGRDAANLNLWGFMEPTPNDANNLVGVRETLTKVPSGFTASAYPNPFNPSTTIYYKLDSEAEVSIAIFNMLGEQVWSSTPGFQKSGYYSIPWNGLDDKNSKLSSGIYMIRLNAGKNVRIIKSILVK